MGDYLPPPLSRHGPDSFNTVHGSNKTQCVLGMARGCLASASKSRLRQFGASTGTFGRRVFPIPPNCRKHAVPLTIPLKHSLRLPHLHVLSNTCVSILLNLGHRRRPPTLLSRSWVSVFAETHLRYERRIVTHAWILSSFSVMVTVYRAARVVAWQQFRPCCVQHLGT